MSERLHTKDRNFDSEVKQMISVNKSKEYIKLVAHVFNLEDGEFKIAYMPVLNLSGYGKTHEEAREMLEEAMDDYFEALIQLKPNQIALELAKYGWEKVPFHNKQYINSSYIDKDGVLREFSLPKDTPIEQATLTV